MGLAGGVITGIALHTGLRRRTVTLLFLVLAASGGLGVALYATYWIVLPTPEGARRSRLPRPVEAVLLGVVVLGAIALLASRIAGGSLFVPTLLACLGGATIWRQAAGPDRERWLRASRSTFGAPTTDRMGRLRLLLGAALVVAGGVLVLHRANVNTLRDGLWATGVTAVGLALLGGPWWIRLTSQLGAERAERIRGQERADLAAHLHDSVLQTLALIQRNADSPREVTRLARGQERELRGLLYGTRAAGGQLDTELRTAAAEVEDAYAVKIDIVVVGDLALDDALAAACAAAREAMVNAARHSGATDISLYAEVEADAVSVFVRDRGVGFEPGAVAEDRQGVRGSIIGRVERNGGTVSIRSSPGGGTEVAIRMRR
ncbi:putative signal transduction histidine kinase [Pseudofrankia inefficax]|uniref:Putative signal transduction histidine kinase n=1 Tax=Pseudofrankia inefficax (strain DSM 45817 / CECT 9037 / DDB 130130 / EuI1c) TaxID=298654 RepID=E3JCT8_PSEI1|nr:putative signal transduction histidine kinase [Pseudofrankia inefficax]